MKILIQFTKKKSKVILTALREAPQAQSTNQFCADLDDATTHSFKSYIVFSYA